MVKVIIAYLLNIMDYIFTAYLINKYGIGIELNGIGRWLFENNVAWVYKIFVVGAIMALLGYINIKHKKGTVAIYLVLGGFAVLAVYHLVILIGVGMVN